MSSIEGSNTNPPGTGDLKLGPKRPGGKGCFGPIQKLLKNCCNCCPCFNFKAVILLFSWLWVAISFVSVSIFIRSVDEDVAYSKIMLTSQKFENETIDIIVQNPIRPFKVRKVVLLFDFGLMCLLDFIADLLLTIGIYKGRPELVTQWISTTIIWLTLLSVGPIVKLNPASVEETKIISIGIMILGELSKKKNYSYKCTMVTMV